MSLLDTKLDCGNGIVVHFGELLNELPVESAIVLMVIHDILATTFYENFISDDGTHYIEDKEIEQVLSQVIGSVRKELIFLLKNGYILGVISNNTKCIGINCNKLTSVFSGETP